MKKKLIIFMVLTFLAGVACSSFAATMSSSSALAYTDSTATSSPSISSIWKWIYPSIVYSTGKVFSSKTDDWDHEPTVPTEPGEPAPMPVSEPLTLILLGSGIVGICAFKKKIRL